MGEGRKPHAFVVDDDASLRLQASAALNQRFNVTEFEGGEALIEALDSMRPDVILLDVLMPGMDGYEACQKVRRHLNGRFVPVLMMTGLDDVDSMEHAYEVGATDFITKPINWPLLHHRVRYMVRTGRAYESLRLSEVQNRALLEALPDTVLRIHRSGRAVEVAPGPTSAGPSGTPTEWIGELVSQLFEKDWRAEAEDVAKSDLDRQSSARVMEFDHPQSGRCYEARVSAYGDEEVLAILRDVTERRRAEDEIKRLAFHDDLTGLPNRAFFLKMLDGALSFARRHNLAMAILFVDLDGFKRINDSLGHHHGDRVLSEASKRMTESLRPSDAVARAGAPDTSSAKIARLGGDEFSVLLPGVFDAQTASVVAGRILERLKQPFFCDGTEIHITASIGVAVWPDDGDDAGVLLRSADTAMYQAKASGGGSFEFYTPAIGKTAERRLQVEVGLRRALRQNEFEVYYQPQVELKTGKIVGAEALLRWTSPELGVVPPNEFIPVGERIGSIVSIGEWVLETACREAQLWQEMGLGDLAVAVNVSSVQFRGRDMISAVERALESSGLEPRLLEVELTESTLMQDPRAVLRVMLSLHYRGIRFAIDDFGTGYSSLSYVQNLPVDTIKLDGAFLRGVPAHAENLAIAGAVQAMARGLDLAVIAEGVETEVHRRFLLGLGYKVGQGFLFRPPVRAKEFRELLAEGVRFELPEGDGELDGADGSSGPESPQSRAVPSRAEIDDSGDGEKR